MGFDPTEIALRAVKEFGALQKPDELRALLELLDVAEPRLIIEIGSDSGGTLYAWSQLPGPPEVIAVDLSSGPFRLGFGPPMRHGDLTLVDADSHQPETLESVVKILDGRHADMLMIDGDHRYEGVMADWRMYRHLVRYGGLVVFHDVCEHENPSVGVRKAWKEIAPSWPHLEIMAEPFTWGGIGVLTLASPLPQPPARVPAR